MGYISSVEIHEYTYEAPDVDLDGNRVPVYEPGSRLRLPKYAVVVTTDDGVRGEYAPIWSAPPVALGETLAVAPRLIGMQTRDRERLYDVCRRALRKHDHIGYGALDICLWDAYGKETGSSVAGLLGQWRDSLPAYASTLNGDSAGGLSDPDSYAAFAEECYALGYRAFKVHGPSGANSEVESAIVRRLGDRVGGRMRLMTDPASGLDTFAEGLALGRACDDAGFFWLEDPMADTGVSAFAHRRLREMIRTPLLLTEHLRGVEPKADFLLSGGTDFVRADPELDLGITGAMKIARMAEALGVDVEMHGAGPGQRHCMAAARNSNFYEVNMVHPLCGNPLIPPIYAPGYSDALDAVGSDGTFPVPSGPGLGVEYDWDYISKNTTYVHRFPEGASSS